MNTKLKFAAVLAALQIVVPAAFAADSPIYQVTGPVLEVNSQRIVVDKNGERWIILRNQDTKVAAAPKVGDKVTIKYKMVAEKIDVAGAKKK